MKTCTKCKVAKRFSEFHKREERKYGLAGECKSCVKAVATQWNKENSKKRKIISGRYYKKNSKKIRATSKKWKTNNNEKIKATQRKWEEENPYDGREKATRYRARKLNAFVAPVDRQEIFERDGGKCHICKKSVDPINWHLDHIIPLAREGTHEPRNVAVSHPRCNRHKSAYGIAQIRLFN